MTKKYINIIFDLDYEKIYNNRPNILNELVYLSQTIENGIINIVQDNVVASAKSIIGVFNINWTKPCKLLIQAYLDEDELSEFKKYKI